MISLLEEDKMGLKEQNTQIVLAKATLDDLESIVKISKETFLDTFGAYNSHEDIENYFKKAYSNSSISREINEKEASFILAYYKGEISAYIKTNIGRAQTELQENQGLEVERIYVRTAFKRRGIGKALINYAIKQAHDLGKQYIWLGVWENNSPAISFYKKLGFLTFGDHSFELGNDLQRDLLMKKNLN